MKTKEILGGLGFLALLALTMIDLVEEAPACFNMDVEVCCVTGERKIRRLECTPTGGLDGLEAKTYDDINALANDYQIDKRY